MRTRARRCVFPIELRILRAFHWRVNLPLSNRGASLELNVAV